MEEKTHSFVYMLDAHIPKYHFVISNNLFFWFEESRTEKKNMLLAISCIHWNIIFEMDIEFIKVLQVQVWFGDL